ncbi:MAG: hypothetical protein A2Y56_05960 [Candidatus Aminicenantes bacterium RBG_13_63_10]|nr:MAG: hypothetical protein A2Y56_05960 [Candidatus Aminicenantes bacterium RBG_13_63_10]
MPSRYRVASIIVLLAAWSGLLIFPACRPAPTEAEMKAMIEIRDVETKWVSKEYRAWPPKLVLVPSISFRVKNLSDKPLTYVNFNAIFKFKDDQENLGDCFLAAIRRTPVPPGGMSPVILLVSNFGVEGKTLASFENNPMWKPVIIKLFAQNRGSDHILLGTYPCSKTIDFTEPAPAETGPGEKKSNQ